MRSLTSRVFRQVWAWMRWLRSEHRKLVVRLLNPGCQIESNVYLGSGVFIQVSDGGKLRIGAGTVVKSNCVIVAKRGTLIIGEGSFIGWGSVICANEEVRIGAHALIAEHVTIRDQNHGTLDPAQLFKDQPMVCAPVILEENVWVGAKATIVSGVMLGTRSVVAANAVVNRAVEARTVVGGIPARPIKRLR